MWAFGLFFQPSLFSNLPLWRCVHVFTKSRGADSCDYPKTDRQPQSEASENGDFKLLIMKVFNKRMQGNITTIRDFMYF